MIKKILFGFVFLILIINFANLVSAERYEDNYFKYGIINTDGSLETTSTKINNVNVLGVICSSEDCGSISGYLYDGEILISSEDYIQLTYPTVLASSHGYGIYMFKDGYIPYELNADYWGTNPHDPQGPYDNYLTRKEVCKADVTEMNADESSGIISADAKIYASITNAGPLDYIPEEIKSYYSTDVKVVFEIKEDSELVYSEEKTVNIEFSENEIVSFSSPELDAGTYNVSITSVSNDIKCLSSLDQQASKIIVIEEQPIECNENSDCGTSEFIGNVFCSSDDLFQNYITYTCNNPETPESYCSDSTSPKLKQDCGDSSCGNFGENYCKGDDVYHSRNCVDKGCESGSCFSENRVDEQLIKECDYDCVNGDCIDEPEPVCGNGILETGEECDDGNLINNDGCSSLCEIEEIVCNTNSDCGTPHCNNPLNFCYNNDIFQEYMFYTCNNPGTADSYCSNYTAPFLILDCGEDSCDDFGENYCKDEDVYNSRTCYQRGCRDSYCFIDSFNEEELIMDCENGCLDGECIDQPIEPPIINLVSPANNTSTTNTLIDFTYNVISDSFISNCSLIIDDITRLTSNSISTSEINLFEYNPSIGTHNWLVSCTNAFDMTNVSETRILIISQLEECTSDSQCGSDFYSDKYCSDDDVYRDYHDFSCVDEECEEEITKELVKECDEGCRNGECKSHETDTWCIETNNCELTYDDSAEFDDSITLKSNDIAHLGDAILLSNIPTKTTAKQPISWFWIIVLAIAIIIILILVFFLLI